MDLKIKDVAELLNVSETTIRRWLAEGKIPAYKINGQYRFSRIEIESWVMNHKLNKADGTSPFTVQSGEKGDKEKKRVTGGSQQFSLYRALHKGQVLKNVTGGTKEDVIRRSTKALCKDLEADSEVLADLLIDRERLQPTALNNGIAVPHTRDFLMNPSYDIVSFAFLEKPITYGALDGKPVHTLIFLFACNDKRHLHLLAKIAHLSSQHAALSILQGHPNKDKLLEYVKGWESNIPHPHED